MSKIQEISNAIELGKKKVVLELVEQALAEGYSPLDILNQGMIDAMGVVGEKFKSNEIYVPEMLVAARAMKAGVEVLRPHLGENEGESCGKFIIGSVEGDLHDIGKNLVAMMVESTGYTVIDIGVDVSAEKLIEAIKENPDCNLIGLSSLLTTTMPAMKRLVAAVKEAGLHEQVKIMVGGAPISQEFANSIGADAFAADAATAAAIAKKLAS
ncbi:putative cobalamin binding protein [Desulfitobacterium dichloroeliminans LMG P-21439]|uniref:Putative cobalamin binding protein n=1 Tax=Desulfitobacterium dichloroeliminans (strain LMG P-21439 / DCA1) TaxID=871963 RepID=L0FAB7_DESDL|nr:corrinoid protein [Desulfitobacterium dichloroeliminans]AGA69970.1 putative cobalamin binding protein [Desulfitobacterium dichloroeliminans LMG P-21439]